MKNVKMQRALFNAHPVSNFLGTVPSVEPTTPQLGVSYKILGTAYMDEINGTGIPFVLSEDGTKFYLSYFTRRVKCLDGTYVTAKGTVVDAIQECMTWDEAANKVLFGKEICVTDIKEVPIRLPNGTVILRKVYTFDFA